MRKPGLIVVGGGLIGSAIAWGAQRAGAHVLLLDEGDVAHRAARGNFGLVWLQGKGVGVPPYMHWSLRAGEAWPDFARAVEDESGLETGWRRCGGFHFCFSGADMDKRRTLAQRGRADGAAIAIEMVDADTLRRQFPALGPRVAGASWSQADGHVNPLKLMRALQVGLQRQGGVYRAGAAVTSIRPDGSGFRVETRAGTFGAGRVVLAAGLGTVALAAPLGIAMPLAPERGQIVVTERIAPFFPHVSNCLQQTLEGTMLLGSTHEQAGFDDGTQVSAAGGLAAGAIAIFPALARANVVRYWGSLRVMSPDGLPIYEESASHPGLFAVTCHSGVTLASLHGLTLGPALAQGGLPEVLGPFSLERFHARPH